MSIQYPNRLFGPHHKYTWILKAHNFRGLTETEQKTTKLPYEWKHYSTEYYQKRGKAVTESQWLTCSLEEAMALAEKLIPFCQEVSLYDFAIGDRCATAHCVLNKHGWRHPVPRNLKRV
jgi:hypothetical protein